MGLLVSVAGYLLVSNAALESFLGETRLVFLLLALLPPYLLWLFVIEIFEISCLKHPVRYLIFLAPIFVYTLSIASEQRDLAQLLHQVMSLLLVCHVLVISTLAHKDDLLDKRRQFRLWFVALITLQTTAILVVEILYLDDPIPELLEALNVSAISLLILSFSLTLLRDSQGELLWHSMPSEGHPVGSSANATASNPLLTEQLLDVMSQGFFMTTGLSIKRLAEHLNTTEHQLRATINKELGYRNFNAFLNKYRIDAAKTQLQDKSLAKTPILTIALDLGYQSIGPFNRAFKVETGVTPSEYRKLKQV